jgi:biopolymer transport protein ExbD
MYDFNQKPELNITPLVDVMLVLLAILMVTAPVIDFEESINLPKGSKTKQVEATENINIYITKDKSITINKRKFEYNNFADNFVLFSKDKNKETPIHIRAERTLLYDDIVYILKSVKEAGFYKVALITDG